MRYLNQAVAAVSVCCLMAGVTAKAGEHYAFLVSVQDYDEKELRPLQFTHRDLKEFRAALLESGFREDQIVWMHDDIGELENRKYLPEAEKIRRQFRLLLAGLQEGDTVLVALAGHGVQFRNESESYFCPADTRLGERRTLISMAELYEELKECKATRKLLLVDACRNDPQSALSRSRASVELESVTRPQRTPQPEGLIAFFSCGPGQQSYEHPSLKHGIFFHHVLKAWNGEGDVDGDRTLTFDELSGFVRRETATYARRHLDALQTPHLKSDSTGDWVLRTFDAKRPRVDVARSSRREAVVPEASDSVFFPRRPDLPIANSASRLAEAERIVGLREQELKAGIDLYNQNEVTKDEIVRLEEAMQRAREEHRSALVESELQAKSAGQRPKGEPAFQASPASSPGQKAAARFGRFRPAELKAMDEALRKAQLELQDAEATHARVVLIYSQGKSTKLDVFQSETREQSARSAVMDLQRRVQELELKLGVN